MSHDRYQTTKDKMRSFFGASTVGWAAVAVALGIGAAGMETAALAIGLGLASAYSLYKSVETFTNAHAHHKKPDVHSEEYRKTLAPNLANNLDPVPELADDNNNKVWRGQLSQQATQRARNNWQNKDPRGY